MKQTIALSVSIAALMLLLVKGAAAQDENVVKFQEMSGELQGQISLVQADNKVLIAERNSVPYSFKTTSATRITISNQRANLEDLVARKGQNVTVKFRVTRNGNMAREITVS